DAFVDCCNTLVKQYDGRVPGDPTALESLPGVGHYVAGAVRCFGFGIRSVLIDTNTIRLASRISGQDLLPENHRSLATKRLVSRLAGKDGLDAADGYALLDLAALVCVPREPRCPSCPVRRDCAFGATAHARTRAACDLTQSVLSTLVHE